MNTHPENHRDVQKIPNKKTKGKSKAVSSRKRRGTPETFILTAAAIMLVMGIIFVRDYTLCDKNYRRLTEECTSSVTGSITENESGCVVSYRADNRTYTAEISNVTETGDVTVMYSPADPKEMYLSGHLEKPETKEIVIGTTLTLFGTASAAVGIIRKIKRLREVSKNGFTDRR
jgi:hypothetical protein